MQNGIAIQSTSSITSANLAKLVAGKVFNIIILVGDWHPDYTINYYDSSSHFSSLINTIHSYNSNFKVYAWVNWNVDSSTKIDLSQSGYRSTMYSAIKSCLAIGFDGFNDDLEPYWTNGAGSTLTNIITSDGSWGDYITYLTGMASACHSVGKLASADMDASYATGNTIYSAKTGLDYACPMMYQSNPDSLSDLQTRTNQILTASNSPVMLFLAAGQSPSLTQQQTAIDQQIASHGPYVKLAGFGIYSLDDSSSKITSGEWSAWDSWQTKG